MKRMVRILLVALWLLPLLQKTASAAGPARVYLTWAPARTAVASAHQPCISRELLMRAVEQRLGRQPFVERERADVVVSGTPFRRGNGWGVRLQMQSATGEPLGEREVFAAGEHCSALSESLILVLALTIDIPQDELPPPKLPAAAPARQPTPKQSVAFLPELAMAGTLGIQPRFAVGPSIAAGVEFNSTWFARLSAAQYSTQRAHLGAAGGEFSTSVVSLDICPYELGLSQLIVSFCLAQSLARLRAQGYGFDQNQREQRWLFNLGAGLSNRWHFATPIFLHVGVSAEVALGRNDFFFRSDTGKTEIFSLPPVALRSSFGLGVVFK